MRQYERIWFNLKNLPPADASSTGVSVTAPKYFHKRLIKAVTKEKWMDTGYKLWLSMTQEGKEARLSYTKSGSILTFYLSFTITVTDL